MFSISSSLSLLSRDWSRNYSIDEWQMALYKFSQFKISYLIETVKDLEVTEKQSLRRVWKKKTSYLIIDIQDDVWEIYMFGTTVGILC